MAVTTPQPWHHVAGATPFTRSEAARRAREILESPEYKTTLDSRMKSGTLPPAIEMMLWHYAYGKPIEQVQVNVTQDLTSLSIEDLYAKARELADVLEEAQALNNAIPAQYKVA